MFEIRSMLFDENNNVAIEEGVRVTKKHKKYIPIDSFWGLTSTTESNNIAPAVLHVPKGEYHWLLSCITDFSVQDLNDGLKRFSFHIGKFEPDNKEGYIIFIKKAASEIKTNGQRVFGRTPNEAVLILKDGEYIEVGERRLGVIDKRLVLYI